MQKGLPLQVRSKLAEVVGLDSTTKSVVIDHIAHHHTTTAAIVSDFTTVSLCWQLWRHQHPNQFPKQFPVVSNLGKANGEAT